MLHCVFFFPHILTLYAVSPYCQWNPLRCPCFTMKSSKSSPVKYASCQIFIIIKRYPTVWCWLCGPNSPSAPIQGNSRVYFKFFYISALIFTKIEFICTSSFNMLMMTGCQSNVKPLLVCSSGIGSYMLLMLVCRYENIF